MLIDNSATSNSIQNVSYLMPIGICLFSSIGSVKETVLDWLQHFGLQFGFDRYLNYWFSHIVTLIVISFTAYFLVRSIWRRIIKGELNCSRLFVSFLVIAIVFFGLWYLSFRIIDVYREAGAIANLMLTEDYHSFLTNITPFTWMVEFVIILLSITFATKESRKELHFEN